MLGLEIMQLRGEEAGSHGNVIKIRKEKRNTKSMLYHVILYLTNSNSLLVFQAFFCNQ